MEGGSRAQILGAMHINCPEKHQRTVPLGLERVDLSGLPGFRV